MKTIKLFIALLFLSISVNAQIDIKDYQSSRKKHELSIDVLKSIFDKYELSYDYILDDNSSIGASISYSSDKVTYNYGAYIFREKFSTSVNYKLFFSKKRAQGFYVEVFSKFSNGIAFCRDSKYSTDLNKSRDYNSIYAGLNLGYKYVNKKEYFFKTSVGISKRLVNFGSDNEHYNSPPIKSNISFSIGKRF